MSANVPDVVTGLPPTVKKAGADNPTDVTVPEPPPAGVAQDPSPRQNVELDAPVPLLRFPTGRLPVTWLARLTLANVPPSVRLPELVTVPDNVMPLTVPVPPTDVTVPAPDGVAQLPSPRQKVVAVAPVPLPRLETGRLPVTPVVSGRPVALVRTPLAGVPSAGVVSVGLVSVRPATVAAVAPSATLVDPIVTVLLVSPALGIVVDAVTALAPLAYI